MVSVPNRIKQNQKWWDTFRFKTPQIFDATAKKLMAPSRRPVYEEISKGVWQTPERWFIIAVAHEREGGGSFNTYLGNGQILGRMTTLVPKGRGPFFDHPDDAPLHDAFYRGALDAMIAVQKADRWPDWTPGGGLTFLESFNGFGYANKGKPSPYIWSGTNIYVSGKYTSDGHYDPNAVDRQLGCGGLIRYMQNLPGGDAINWPKPGEVEPPIDRPPIEPPADEKIAALITEIALASAAIADASAKLATATAALEAIAATKGKANG